MKLSKKLEKFSHLQLLFGFSLFYVFCLYDNVSGVLYPVFLTGMLMMYQCLMEQAGRSIKKDSKLYMLAILLLGISTFLTGNFIIIWCNKLAVWVLFGILLLHDGYEDQKWTVFRYVGGLWELAMMTLAHLFTVFPELAKSRRVWKEQAGAGEKKQNGKLIYVILGILLGATLLCLILPLLISADAVFDQMLGGAFDWVVRVLSRIILPTKLLLMTLMFLWGLMFFFGIYSAVKNRKPQTEEKDLRTQEPVLAITVLAVIGVVYLLFCMVQISYLFTGGFTLPAEYSYAGFARQGFFQLLFISALNLMLVLVTLSFFRENTALKIMLTFLSACTYILIISSACRMFLYIQAYQLTRLRVLVLFALLVLAVLFAGVIRSIYQERFPMIHYSVAVVAVLYLVLSFSHMDAWIASYNIAHDQTSYLYELSTDASGPMLKAAKEGTAEVEMTRAYFSMNKYQAEAHSGMRKFNVSEFLFGLRCKEYFCGNTGAPLE